jgi:hypothetical protein
MNESQSPKPDALVTKRHISLAGLAAILGCAACCALPFLAAAGLGSGAAAGVGRIVRPGSELVVGGVVFAATLAFMAIRRRLRRQASCRASCDTAGNCCHQGRLKA